MPTMHRWLAAVAAGAAFSLAVSAAGQDKAMEEIQK
jgi:hypothetical protein